MTSPKAIKPHWLIRLRGQIARIPAPTLHVFINLGIIEINTQNMGVDYLRRSFVYTRLMIRVLRWTFHVSLESPEMIRAKFHDQDMAYRIRQITEAYSRFMRAVTARDMDLAEKEHQFISKLLHQAHEACLP